MCGEQKSFKFVEYDTLKKHARKFRDHHKLPQLNGRPHTFTSEEETQIAAQCRDFEFRWNHLTYQVIIQEALYVAFARNRPEGVALADFKRFGGREWIKAFCKRNGFDKITRSRPLEKERQ